MSQQVSSVTSIQAWTRILRGCLTLILLGVVSAVIQSSSKDAVAQSEDRHKAASAGEERPENGNDDDLPDGARLRLGVTRLRCSGGPEFVTFSRDGRWIISGGRRITYFDAKTGRRDRQLPLSAKDIAVSPDGTKLLILGDGVRQWDCEAKREIAFAKELTIESASAISWLADGGSFATVVGKSLQIRDTESGEIERSMRLEGLQRGPCRLAVSSNGRLIAAGYGNQIRIWSLTDADRGPLVVGDVHGRRLDTLTFSPDDRALISGGCRYEVAHPDVPDLSYYVSFAQLRRWEAATGELMDDFIADEPETRILDVKILKSENQLVVRMHNEIRFLDAETGIPERIIEAPAAYTHGSSMAISRDGTRIVAAAEGALLGLWDVPTGKRIDRASLSSHDDAVRALAYSPDGSRIATASDDGNMRLWDVRTGRHIRAFEFGKGALNLICVAFSPDGKHCAIGGRILPSRPHELEWRGIKIWDVNSGELTREIPTKLPPFHLAFSPDGASLLAAPHSNFDPFEDPDTTISVFDVETGRPRVDFRGHAGMPMAAWCSPDGERARSLDEFGQVLEWKATDGAAIEAVLTEGRGVGAFSHDGKFVASVERDLTLSNAATGDKRWSLPVASRVESHAICFSTNDRRLAVAGNPSVVVDVAKGAAEQRFEVDDASVMAVALSPDGDEMAMGLDDGTVLLWPVSK